MSSSHTVPAQDGSNIFVSYSRVDLAWVTQLVKDLQGAGLKVWLDVHMLQPGSAWDSEIEQALQRTGVLMAVLSPDSVKSRNVLDEISYALGKDRLVVPVLYRPCEIPYRVARLQHVDFTGDRDAALQRLIARLRVAVEECKAAVAADADLHRTERHELPAWPPEKGTAGAAAAPAAQTSAIPSPESGSLLPGMRLGPYEILAPLGAGGMGEVLVAIDTRLGRKVALKILPVEMVADADRVRRFTQEARAASALNHPSILTIFDVGTEGALHYIAAELVEGETLRQRLARSRPTLREVVDTGIQVAGALSAAHAAGIVHRDIKPENVMVRPDGVVKVLDFGLAKLTAGKSLDEAVTTATDQMHTRAGVVLGTIRYMSPEQARGLEVDGRTDVFSLGAVLYELATGHAPFGGETGTDTLIAVATLEPEPLSHSAPDTPPELERIVTKALRKNRDERYQTAKDLLNDLKELQRRQDVEAEIARSGGSGPRPAAARPSNAGELTRPLGVEIAQPAPAARSWRPTRRIGLAVGLGVLAVVAAVTVWRVGLRSPAPPALTDKDTILLAEIQNQTGEAVFDGTLRQGLAVQLQQSPFLDLFSDARLRETLRLMGRSTDDRVTKEVAREVCQRQGLKALISGNIARFERNYSLTLEAINSQTGETIGLSQVEAEGKDQVLKALSRAAADLRQKLGESLSSIQSFDAPLEVTTPSLEALQAFSLGREEEFKGRPLEALPFYKRAVELDPNFAYGWSALAVMHFNTDQPALASEAATRAFALRDRASENEKLRITAFYYMFVTGEVEKQIEAQEIYKRMYPRDDRGPGNLALSYARIGQFEKALAEDRDALRLNPTRGVWLGNVAIHSVRLNRFAEAREACAKAIGLKLDGTDFRTVLYHVAFVEGDREAMRQQVEWANGQPDEYVALDWQTATAAFGGQWRRAQELARRAVDLATRADARGVAASYAAEQALRAAVLGQPAVARSLAAQAVSLERGPTTLSSAALAFALAGDAGQARTLTSELLQQFPKDTTITGLWVPTINAAVEQAASRAQGAVEQLEPVRRYESAAEFWPQYIRGQALLALGKGAEAAAEFQKVLDHRGHAPLSLLFPLSQLGRARAAEASGEPALARDGYRQFLELWKEADPDLRPLQDARRAAGADPRSGTSP